MQTTIPTVIKQPELFNSARARGFLSTDVDEMRHKIALQYCDHWLDPVTNSGLLDGCYATVPLGDISINYLRYGADVAIDVGDFENFYMVEFPLSGAVEIAYGEQQLVSSGSNGVVISPGRYVKSRWSEDCAEIMLKINKEPLNQYLQSMLMCDVRDPVVFDPTISINHGAGRAIYELLQYLISQSKHEDSLFGSPMIMREMQHTLYSILLNSQPHNYSEPVGLKNHTILPKHVHRAYEYIKANAHDPITMQDLVALTNVSERTLYSGFKSFLGASPRSCIRTCRLERARDLLAAAESPVSVAEVARRCGFKHASRFSQKYKKHFGEYPSETLGVGAKP